MNGDLHSDIDNDLENDIDFYYDDAIRGIDSIARVQTKVTHITAVCEVEPIRSIRLLCMKPTNDLMCNDVVYMSNNSLDIEVVAFSADYNEYMINELCGFYDIDGIAYISEKYGTSDTVTVQILDNTSVHNVHWY